ncbi:uncharacterized protein LOC100118458 [Nasonia vitripennis]|uniref:Uncharacterized protein n=1 Tax=Nasonia vitripennis TaxID=7425 RepID=A0A7M7G3W5_NASVI|nr:uncharacterized protein LOC100118458 [Nasonia vitripennis]
MSDEAGPSSSTTRASLKPSQGYLYACQRAELLGLPTPTEAEWLASEECAREREAQEQDAHDDAVAQELDEKEEGMKRVGGGLDELNTILNATQKKINKFKTVCGSIGTLLKARVSSQPGTPEHKSRAGSSTEPQPGDEENPEQEQPPETNEEAQPDSEPGVERPRMTAKKTDLNAKVGSHLDKLDSLITKAENAQYSMKHQNKQMKSFLK